MLRKLLQRGAVQSPALKLIEAAHSAGKLDELQERIDSIIPADQEMQRAKLTLQFLTQIALQEDLAARTTFGKFFESSVEADRSKLTTRWNDFLVFWAGMHAPELRKTVGTSYFDLYRDPSDASPQSQLEIVTDYIRALQGTYQHLVLHNTNHSPVNGRDLRSQWIPVSSTSAATRGLGEPRAFWETTDGQAFRITGHQTDYLFYRVPLRGNFQVECNAHPSLSRSLSLMVAGTYAAMNDNSHVIFAGNFGAPPKTVSIEPQLSQFREVVRLRATVHDGVLTHYINGRPVYRKELPPDHDPWVAIRTGDRSMGIIRDLRITGEPIIPEQIDLISNTELDGWAACHADLSDWGVLGNASGELELHSSCREELAGSFAENLLTYHRPLAEDGTIEYDFFYSAGESGMHPALDRLAFLLNPDGISLHTIIDGKYNRSGFPPDNETSILRTQTESQPLPLLDDDWNHVRLAISGDELELFLNSRSIHRQTVDSSQPRTFGLFHYRDRTQARVRNIVWRGDWPKEIPPVFEQQLATRELQFLEDSLPQLK
ncbi:MAG TPA: DUF1583 domain-containing protein, partial [Planctomycetaceae bacterium]|nr:DUF1583 domain-containing protein [Planctomycetaceae bacterium]